MKFRKKNAGFAGKSFGTFAAKTRKEPVALTPEEAWPKLLRYCAYQERSPAEVLRKMAPWQLTEQQQTTLLEKLKEENYLSEERFVAAYTGGKLRMNGWGKTRIKQGLAQKGIAKEVANEALSEVDEKLYLDKLRALLEKERAKYQALPAFQLRQRLYKVALAKGFEFSIIEKEVGLLDSQ